MSDLARFLPLSQRPTGDESGVTSNWSRPLGVTLLHLADLLEQLNAAGWDAPAMQAGYTVRDTVGHVLWSLGSTRAHRLAEVARRALNERRLPPRAVAEFAASAASVPEAELVASIRAFATAALTPHARHRLRDLTVVVVDGFDIAHAVGIPLEVDPIASGAVALARASSAPLAIRSVLRERRLMAVDSDWAMGTGTPIRATAGSIILFLWGRRGVPASAE